MVGIVTDSAASLDDELARRRGIVVVPMQIEVEGRALPDGAEGLDGLVASVGNGAVRTAGPTPAAFTSAVKEADTGDGVVVITVASRLSSTFAAARLAAAEADFPVAVVDSGTAAGAEGLIALAAAGAALAGRRLEAVRRRAEMVRARVRLVAEVGNLTQLVRGGRVPAPLGALGNAVGLHPVFELRRGEIRLLRPALSERAATELMLTTWRRSVRPGHHLHVAGLHVDGSESVEDLLDAVAGEVVPITRFVGRFGPVMVAHTGRDIRGLAWWWEPHGDDPGTPGLPDPGLSGTLGALGIDDRP
ncbi:MAG: DegV family protein [Acidimicrobiales bacterium]